MAGRLTAEVRELGKLFLYLGLVGFGGPAAHIALMEEQVVRRRGWLSREEFLDMVGVVHLLPGPNSTELAIHIGYRRAGVPGLIVAGLAFILPATLMVVACAWAYRRYGTLPEVAGIRRGVEPVVIAVIATALAGFARTGLRASQSIVIAIVALGLALAGVHELLVLLAAGVIALVAGATRGTAMVWAPVLLPVLAFVRSDATPGSLFLFFLKIGSVLYGSGYVLLAFLRGELVERAAWLTERELLDAIAVGQATPGPVFTTATFVGYLLDGPLGAVAATAGIFLPAFVLVAASGPLVRWLRRRAPARDFLHGVTAGSIALMALVTWQLGRVALDGWQPLLATLGCLVLLRTGLNSAVLLLGGAAAGLAFA